MTASCLVCRDSFPEGSTAEVDPYVTRNDCTFAIVIITDGSAKVVSEVGNSIGCRKDSFSVGLSDTLSDTCVVNSVSLRRRACSLRYSNVEAPMMNNGRMETLILLSRLFETGFPANNAFIPFILEGRIAAGEKRPTVVSPARVYQ